MTSEETAIVSDIAAAIRALNDALAKAQGSGLKVSVDYTSADEFGKRDPRRVYFADVSKQEFEKRVG